MNFKTTDFSWLFTEEDGFADCADKWDKILSKSKFIIKNHLIEKEYNMDATNFRNFLSHNKSFERFCQAIWEQRNLTFKQAVRRSESLSRIIDNSLTWDATPEGHDYWANLNTKWEKVVRIGKQFQPQYKSIW